MKFKRIIAGLLIACCSVIVLPVFASNTKPPAEAENSSNAARSAHLTERIMDIRDMDKSQLTSSEKRELRKELREIRRERSHGVYLSVGAIIIIILLLILLL